jgi:hypothetical protein
MLNFFNDEITVLGKSNLDDPAVRPCKITIAAHEKVVHGDDDYYSVNFRMGISQQKTELFSLYEMGISLKLEEAEVFCESLYNLAKQNSETKERVEIAFSGDNDAKAIGAPRAYLKRAQVDRRPVPLAITIEPVNSTEGVAEVALKMPDKERFFCSALLSAQDALVLSYMIRCGYVETFHEKMHAENSEV